MTDDAVASVGPAGAPLDVDESDVDALEQRLGVVVGDRTLLRRALVHRSWAHEHGAVLPNERLEFVGDAVLSLVVAEQLYDALPGEPEGRLARIRAFVVAEAQLADLARSIGLGELVQLGVGEAAAGGADKDSILADAFEAVLGAVHLTEGWEVSRDLVRRLVGPRVTAVQDEDLLLDPKTALQELLVAHGLGEPVYTWRAEGPDHAQTFHVTAATRDGEELGAGTGTSKKRAEQGAARAAWRHLRDRSPAAGA